MNHKIEKSTLVGYVYGELDAETHSYVQQAILSDPDLKAEVEALRLVRRGLGRVSDQQVQVPFILAPKQLNTPKERLPAYAYFLGVAASIALLLASASFAKVEFRRDDEGWALRFGNHSEKETLVAQGTSPADLQAMIEASLANNNDSLLNAWNEREMEWKKQFSKLEKRKSTGSGISKAQLSQLAEQIRRENYELMLQLTNWSQDQQKEYISEVVVELTNFLNEQRNQDLQQIGVAFQEVQIQNERSEFLLSELAQYYLENQNPIND